MRRGPCGQRGEEEAEEEGEQAGGRGAGERRKKARGGAEHRFRVSYFLGESDCGKWLLYTYFNSELFP
jgi:hypothetical protein